MVPAQELERGLRVVQLNGDRLNRDDLVLGFVFLSAPCDGCFFNQMQGLRLAEIEPVHIAVGVAPQKRRHGAARVRSQPCQHLVGTHLEFG